MKPFGVVLRISQFMKHGQGQITCALWRTDLQINPTGAIFGTEIDTKRRLK